MKKNIKGVTNGNSNWICNCKSSNTWIIFLCYLHNGKKIKPQQYSHLDSKHIYYMGLKEKPKWLNDFVSRIQIQKIKRELIISQPYQKRIFSQT